jgi:putative ABC transport system substrate-binding protein
MKAKWFLMVSFILITVVILNYSFDTSKETPIRIGVLTIGDSRYEKLVGLQNGLKELGYQQNEFQFIVKNAKENPSKLQKQIDELIHSHPEIIVTLGGIETIELKKVMDKNHINIPVVFAGAASPKEMGMIKDEKAPGGQFTGINNYHTSISGKRLEILVDLIPSIQRVHILYDNESEISKLSLQKTLEAANELSVSVKPWNVSDADFPKNLEKDLKKNDALFLLPSFRIESMTDQLVNIENNYRIPTMGIYEHEVKNGFLLSYGTSFKDQGYQAARYVSLLIKGNSPGELPVEMPDNIRFLVNKQEQDLLGIHFNQDLLKIAEFSDVNKKGSNK